MVVHTVETRHHVINNQQIGQRGLAIGQTIEGIGKGEGFAVAHLQHQLPQQDQVDFAIVYDYYTHGVGSRYNWLIFIYPSHASAMDARL